METRPVETRHGASLLGGVLAVPLAALALATRAGGTRRRRPMRAPRLTPPCGRYWRAAPRR
ncbi:MAG: hypothetical protein U0641_14470 [Anaerolineae bacterium]